MPAQSLSPVDLLSNSHLPRGLLIFLWVGAAVVLASRLYSLSHRGIISYDEAYYLCELRAAQQAFHFLPSLWHNPKSIGALKLSLRQGGAIFPPSTAKPMFFFVLTLGLLLPVPFLLTSQAVSFIATGAMAFVFFRLVRRLGVSREAAPAGALLFFMSPVMGWYSVCALAQPTAMFFYLAALCALMGEHFAAGGFCLGLALSAHYALLPSSGLLLLVGAYMAWRTQPTLQAALLKTGAMTLSFFIPAAIWEFLYRLGKHFLAVQLKDVAYRTYFQQVALQMQRSTQFTLPYRIFFERNLKFYRGFAGLEGWLTFLILTAAAFWALCRLRRLSFRQQGLVFLAWGVSLFWLLSPGTVASRVLVFFVPLLYAVATLALDAALRAASFRPVAIGLLLLTAAFSTAQAVNISCQFDDPYGKASSFLRQRGIHQVMDPLVWPIWQLYMGERMEARPETAYSWQDMQRLTAQLSQEQGGAPVAFFFQGNFPFRNEPPDLDGFYVRLFQRPAAASWPMKFTRFLLAQNEEDVFKATSTEKTLKLYWISAPELHPVAAQP